MGKTIDNEDLIVIYAKQPPYRGISELALEPNVVDQLTRHQRVRPNRFVSAAIVLRPRDCLL